MAKRYLICIFMLLIRYADSSTNGFIGRLVDEPINLIERDIAAEHKRNQKIRNLMHICSTVGTVAGISAITYFWFKPTAATPVMPVPAAPATLESIAGDMNTIKAYFSTRSQSAWTTSWFKSFGLYILQSAIMINMYVGLAKEKAENFAQKIFYDETIGWYIQRHTSLGIIHERQEQYGATIRSFIRGQLLQEILTSARIADGGPGVATILDQQYHTAQLVQNMKRLLQDIARAVAYLGYTGSCWSAQPEYAKDAFSKARYLFNLTNSTMELLEKQIDLTTKMPKQPVFPTVTAYIAEFENLMLSFSRIEDEYAFRMLINLSPA